MIFLNTADIDRTIKTVIQLQVNSAGYYLDVTPYQTMNNGATQFPIDLEALRQSLPQAVDAEKQLIYVQGVGSAKARGEKRSAQITIDRKKRESGEIGADINIFEKNLDATYKKYKLPANAITVTYEIRIACNLVEYDRIMFSCVSKALGTRRVLQCQSGRTGTENLTFRIDKVNEYDATNFDFIERVMQFEVRDVFLDEYVETSTTPIQKISSPDFEFDFFN